MERFRSPAPAATRCGGAAIGGWLPGSGAIGGGSLMRICGRFPPSDSDRDQWEGVRGKGDRSGKGCAKERRLWPLA